MSFPSRTFRTTRLVVHGALAVRARPRFVACEIQRASVPMWPLPRLGCFLNLVVLGSTSPFAHDHS